MRLSGTTGSQLPAHGYMRTVPAFRRSSSNSSVDFSPLWCWTGQ